MERISGYCLTSVSFSYIHTTAMDELKVHNPPNTIHAQYISDGPSRFHLLLDNGRCLPVFQCCCRKLADFQMILQ